MLLRTGLALVLCGLMFFTPASWAMPNFAWVWVGTALLTIGIGLIVWSQVVRAQKRRRR